MTTWLTRILLDPRHAAVRRDLSDAIRLHQRAMSLMPDGLGDQARQQTGLLYRLDESRTGTHLLIQSSREPAFGKLPAGYGTVAVRDIDPLLDALDKGVAVHYRLAANASKRLGRNAEHPGKIVALRGEAAEQWWALRAEQYGLAMRTITTLSQADATGRRDGHKPVKHAITRFDGQAVVADPDALRRAIRDGIGRGKSYGCGLLSLAPVNVR